MKNAERRNGPRREMGGAASIGGPRRAPRLFANKYINGTPHVVEVLDVAAGGVAIRTILEPETEADAFPLELALDGPVLWAWTRRVWRRGNREALRILSADNLDVARLEKFLRHAIA